MHLHHLTRYLFSTNYVSQFRVRSRLADFFKHIHPDQMAQAPTKIREENLRSLKNLNSYFDSINQNKAIDAKLLKFYISEKTNQKSRKFFSFSLELPDLKAVEGGMEETKAGRLIDDIVNALNAKHKQSRDILDGKKEKPKVEKELKEETEAEKEARMQEQIGPHKRRSIKHQAEEEALRKAIEAKYMESEKQDLKLRLRQKMSFADTSTNKPMLWSRLALNESGIYDDYQSILQKLIDPKLIFFDEELGTAQIEEFKKSILPGQLDRMGVKATQAVLEVCEQMEQCSPPLCLYVTRHYSATDIPGFFSVPYNFKPVQLRDHFRRVKETLISEQAMYEQLYDDFNHLAQQLLKQNNLKVMTPAFKGNPDLKVKTRILQVLKKYSCSKVTQVRIMDVEEFKILCNEYGRDNSRSVEIVNNKLFIRVNVKDEDVKNAIEVIQQKDAWSQQQQSTA